jgi:hypothetical protein
VPRRGAVGARGTRDPARTVAAEGLYVRREEGDRLIARAKLDSVEDRGMATTRVRSLSLPSDLVREVERLAKQEGATKTEILREALRRYGQERRWRGLQRYGAGRARTVGVRGGRRGHRPGVSPRPKPTDLILAILSDTPRRDREE